MKRMVKRLLVAVLTLSMTIGFLPQLSLTALAVGPIIDPTIDITAESYQPDQDGKLVFEINPENVENYSNVRDIFVPSNCQFTVMGVDFSFSGSLTTEAGSTVQIVNEMDWETFTVVAEGKINGEFVFANGTEIMFGNKDNIPNGFAICDEFGNPLPQEDIDNMMFASFTYQDGKWLQPPYNPFLVDLFVDGTQIGERFVEYKLEYSYDNGSNWENAFSNENNVEGFITSGGEPIELKAIPPVAGEGEEGFHGDVTFRFTIRENDIPEGFMSKDVVVAEFGVRENPDDHPFDVMNGYDPATKTLNFTLNLLDESIPHDFHVALAYAFEGDRGIIDESTNYLYAYTNSDFDENGSVDTDDIKYAFATELVERFIDVSMYGEFGECWDRMEEDKDIRANYKKDSYKNICSRINLTADGTVEAIDEAGNKILVNKYKASVLWGCDEVGESIAFDYPVYEYGSSIGSVLVCTDFNEKNGSGETFYIRSCDKQVKIFDSAVEPDNSMKEMGSLVVSKDYEHTVVGGNAVVSNIVNSEGLCNIQLNNIYDVFGKFTDRDMNVVVLDEDDNYVAIIGEGEAKETDGLGLNGFSYGNIWSTKVGDSSKVFIGFSDVVLTPLNNVGVKTYKIKDVVLKDEKQKDGVTIDKSDLNNIKISFKSNFYDSVPIIITYDDGTKNETTIERIGLVISYRYLYGDNNFDMGENTDRIWYDCKPGVEKTFKYNYFKGDHVLVYATYYHPSNDKTSKGGDNLYLNLKYDNGANEIIYHKNEKRGFDGYSAATDGAVATTSFILGIVTGAEKLPSNNEAGYIWGSGATELEFISEAGNKGGFSATVINAGYNDDTSYSGTQVGSGLGVHWDGKISWY